MADGILVLNAGSSSLKFALYAANAGAGDPELAMRGQIAGIGQTPMFKARDAGGETLDLDSNEALAAIRTHGDALTLLLDWQSTQAHDLSLVAAGHRVVHGGTEFSAPVVVDGNVLAKLRALGPLAPHHQPHNVNAIEALSRQAPDLAQVACFDTAFHAEQPLEARLLSLPLAYWRQGLRRYGFHGLSYEYVVATLPGLTGKPLPERLVVAHLGNGASMCAIKAGRSIATTMGFSTLDGLPMGTRSGSVDPGVVLYLMREEGFGADELEDLFYNRSGLAGISELSSDMRVLLASETPKAREAVAYYCYRVERELGSLVAALDGLDALVFTGGVGENATAVRAAICLDAAWCGIDFDADANNQGGPCITSNSSRVPVWVVPTDEELTIARHTMAIVGT